MQFIEHYISLLFYANFQGENWQYFFLFIVQTWIVGAHKK